MARAFAVALGLLAALAAIGSTAEFAHGPYSGAPTEESVVISWSTPASVPAQIEYAVRSDYEATGNFAYVVDVAPFVPDPTHETTHVTLEGLAASEDYVYRVTLSQNGSETVSRLGAFSTAPEPGEPVSFAILADTQQQLEGENRLALVCEGIASDPAPFDFILHAGDVVESPSGFYWDDWFDSFADMLLRAPFIPVLGNHEKNHRSYYEAFELPEGAGKNDERWWVHRWGDVIVIGLDSNVKRATDYTAQQDWLREHLAGPEPHKFVVFHHPVFTSDAYHSSGSFLDKIYHPVFVEMDVDIVINGHSHHYEHIVLEGVTYLVVGGGGATPRRTRPDHIQGSDVSVEGHHFYLRVSTSSEGIDVETISVARELGDGTCAATQTCIDSFSLGDGAIAEASDGSERSARGPNLGTLALLAVAAAAVLLLVARK